MPEEINPQSPTPPEGNQAEGRTDSEHSSTPDTPPTDSTEEVKADLNNVDFSQMTPKEQARVKLFQADYTKKMESLKGEKETLAKEKEQLQELREQAGQQTGQSHMSDDELRQVLGESNPLYQKIKTSDSEVQSLKQKIATLEKANKYALGETLKTSLKTEQKEALEEASELKGKDGKLTKEGKTILEKATETWKNDRLGRSLSQIVKEDYMPAFYLGKNVASLGQQTKKQSNLTMGATAPSEKVDVSKVDWGQLTPEQRTAIKKQTSGE